MADKLGARKDGSFKAVCTAPSINDTPIGPATPPVPYPVMQDLSSSVGVAPSVNFNSDPVYLLNQSTQPSCVGDAPGTALGIKSGTVSGEVKPTGASSTVNATGKPVVRQMDPCTLNGGNCPGIYVTQPAPGGSISNGAPGPGSSPPVKPETPKEESFWHKASPWVHGALGLASFVPGISVASAGIDAAIYAGEGDAVNAALSAAAMIPFGKEVTTAAKVVEGAATMAKDAEAAAKLAKEAHEVEEAIKAAKEAEATAKAEREAEAAAKAEKEAADATKTGAGARAEQGGKDGVKIKSKRPSWRQSEKDVGERLDKSYKEQVSFKDKKEVPYGTEGSTRPDWYKPGSSMEVKNYNIETVQGQDRLVDNVTNQAIERAKDLPSGTVQSVTLDVRGQNVGLSTLENVINRISSGSNGILKPENIVILRN